MSFTTYKGRVLSYINGAHVHKANNILHVVLNRLDNYRYFIKMQDFEQAHHEKMHIDEALLTLSILCGIEETVTEDFI
jgi:hypothetical protein